MLHRALFGSLERYTGILLEHYAGNLPFWLAPLQVVVATGRALVESRAALASIDHDGPCLVEVTVDPMPNPWPFLRMPANRGSGAQD